MTGKAANCQRVAAYLQRTREEADSATLRHLPLWHSLSLVLFIPVVSKGDISILR